MTDQHKKREKILPKLFLGFILLLLSMILLLSMLTIGPGENLLRGIAEKQLRESLGVEVKIAALETNLFSRVQLRQVIMHEAGSGSNIPLLRLEYASAEYRLWDLLRRRLTVESIMLDSLEITVLRDTSGLYKNPLLGFEQEPDDAQPSFFEFYLGKAALQNTTIRYQDSYIPIDGILENVSLFASSGTAGSYSFEARADSAQLIYLEIPLIANHLLLNGHWDPEEFRMDTISLQLPGYQLSGSAAIKTGMTPSPLRGNLSLIGDPGQLVHIYKDLVPAQLQSMKGQFDINFVIDGTSDEPRITAQVEFPVLDFGEFIVSDGSLRGAWNANQVTLDRISMSIFGGVISGRGELALDSLLSHQVNLAVDGVRLEQVWNSISQETPSYQGLIRGNIETTGPLLMPEDLRITSNMELRKVKYQQQALPDFEAVATFEDGLANFDFSHARSRISGAVHILGDNLTGELSAEVFELEPFAALFNITELSGSVRIQGDISGSADSPSVRALISGRGFRYQNFPLDTLAAHLNYDNEQLIIDSSFLEGRLVMVDTLLPPFNLEGVRGGVAYQGHFKGLPEDLEGEIRAEFFQPAFEDFRFDSGSMLLTVANQTIELKALQLQRDSLLARLSAEFSILSNSGKGNLTFFNTPMMEIPPNSMGELTSQYSEIGSVSIAFDISDTARWVIEMQGDKLDLHKILVMYPDMQVIDGRLQFRLNVTGNLADPSGSLSFFIDSPRYEQVNIDSIKGNIHLGSNLFNVRSLDFFKDEYHSWIEAEVALEITEEGGYQIVNKSAIRGKAEGKDIDLKLLKPFLQPGMQISGNSSYSLDWDGTVEQPQVRGEISVRNAEVQLSSESPAVMAIEGRASFKDSVLSLETITGKISEVPFRLQGKMTSRQWREFQTEMMLNVSNLDVLKGEGTLYPDSLNIQFNIQDFNLSPLEAFIPDVQGLRGNLNSELIIRGPITGPQIDGELEIRRLAFQPSVLDAPFTQGIVRISFDQNHVNLDSLFARLNGGSIYVSGNLVHQLGEPTDLNMEARISGVRISRPKEYIFEVKRAQITYKKENNFFELDGDVVLGETRMLYNFRPKDFVAAMQTVERPVQTLPNILQKTRMNIRLRESENIWMDNNLARIRVRPELSVIGSPFQPNLTGRLTTEEGYLLYLDRKFLIKNGVMDFIDPNQLNPIVGLNAEANIKTYQTLEGKPYVISLSVTGPLDQAVVELTSDPPLQKPDILALLTVGATRDQLTGKDTNGKGSGISQVLRDRIAELSSQRVSGYTSRKLGNLLGLEEMSIEGNLFQFDKSWGPQLLASRKITNRMHMTYTTTVGHMNEQSIRLDYRLSKYFSMEGQTDQQSRSGIDLKFGIRFR